MWSTTGTKNEEHFGLLGITVHMIIGLHIKYSCFCIADIWKWASPYTVNMRAVKAVTINASIMSFISDKARTLCHWTLDQSKNKWKAQDSRIILWWSRLKVLQVYRCSRFNGNVDNEISSDLDSKITAADICVKIQVTFIFVYILYHKNLLIQVTRKLVYKLMSKINLQCVKWWSRHGG